MYNDYTVINANLRILHTSDLHLGSGTSRGRHALKSLVEFATNDPFDLVIVAGDLFDSNRVSPDTITFAVNQLKTFGAPVVILPGNHDCLTPDSVYFSKTLCLPNQGIFIYRKAEGETFAFPELNVALWGKPLCDYGGNLRPLSGMPPKGPQRWQIAVAHGEFIQDKAYGDYSFPMSIEEIVACDRDYLALGHRATPTCLCTQPVQAHYCGAAMEMGTFLTVDFGPGHDIKVNTHHLEF